MEYLIAYLLFSAEFPVSCTHFQGTFYQFWDVINFNNLYIFTWLPG